MTEYVKEESAIPVNEISLDPIAVESSSDQEAFNKEIGHNTTQAVFKENHPKSEYEKAKFGNGEILPIDVVKSEISTGKGHFKNKFYSFS